MVVERSEGGQGAAVLCSSGLDSAVLLADVARRETVVPLYVSVGLAWEKQELAMLDRLLASTPFRSVRPIVRLLSLPLYVLTLGLFILVVNALMLLLTSWIADLLDVPFHVDGFWAAVLGGLVISFVSWALSLLLPS